MSFATNAAPTVATSSNWAGYAVAGSPSDSTPTLFTSVTGTWKQPRATCGEGSAGAASAVWVGLGGSTPDSAALEQIGTSADCRQAGKPVYYAWYEIVPSPPVSLKLKVVPGDTITTSVNVSDTTVLLQIKNRTRHTSFTTRVGVTSPDLSSAEWIAEAPSECTTTLSSCHPVPLANFGSVSFVKAAAIGNSHPGTVSDPVFAATAVQLLPDPNQAGTNGSTGTGSIEATAGATPTELTPDGRSFTVTWQANPSP